MVPDVGKHNPEIPAEERRDEIVIPYPTQKGIIAHGD